MFSSCCNLNDVLHLQAISTSFSMATICYGGLGLLGAFMFGDDVNSQVTLNLPSKYIASMVASWLTLIVPITKFGLWLSPVSSIDWSHCHHQVEPSSLHPLWVAQPSHFLSFWLLCYSHSLATFLHSLDQPLVLAHASYFRACSTFD